RRAPLGAWSLRFNETGENYVLEASWLGARAYATWAGGRLLSAAEWERLAEAPTAFEGFDRNDGEWVDGEQSSDRGFRQRPIATLWDARFPAAESHHIRWASEDMCG